MSVAQSGLTLLMQEKYNKNGFFLGERIISDSKVKELQNEIVRVINNQNNLQENQPLFLKDMGSSGRSVWQIVNIHQASYSFKELVMSPLLGEIAAELLGSDEVRLWHDQIQYKPSANGGINSWHQDSPYWPCISPGNAVTAWIALDDVTEDNGCMRMIPGSHQWGDAISFLNHEIKDFYHPPEKYQNHVMHVQCCPVPKGHVHFHHGYTFHGSGDNVSGSHRRALAIHYIGDKTTFNSAGGEHPCKPFIQSKDGEKVIGDAFPIVFQR